MEVKIINNKLDDFGGVFKVRRMNFDNIIINYPIGSGIKSFSFEDVECISQNNIDEFLIKHRDFLKIKLKRGISVIFYNALYESLKIEIKEEIDAFENHLLWSRYKNFDNKEIFNVHGHTIFTEPIINEYSTAIDLGCFQTNGKVENPRLCALEFPSMRIFTQNNIEIKKRNEEF